MYWLIFFFTPVFSIILNAVVLWNKPRVDKQGLFVFSSLFAILFGLINTTKVLESDISNYYNNFKLAGEVNLVSYLRTVGSEPFFYLISWISNRLFFSSWDFFLILITYIDFIVLAYVLITIGLSIGRSNKDIVFVLFLSFLFFQEFSLSSHLMRQILGAHLALAFLINWHVKKKHDYWLGIIAVLTHATVLPIIAIGLLPYTKYEFSLKRLVKILIVSCLMAFFFISVLPMFKGVFFLGYFASRLDSESTLLGSDMGRLDGAGLNIINYLIFVVILSLIFGILHNKNKYYNLKYQSFTIYLPFALILFLLVSNIIHANYLIERYFFYLYPFIGILLMEYLEYSSILRTTSFRIMLIVLLAIYFFTYLETGIFKYESTLDVLFKPAFMYIV